MFGEALIESAPVLRKRHHWPMATAFTVELIVTGALVLLPLISTGVIPLKATVIVPTPTKFIPLERREPVRTSSGPAAATVPTTHVVPVASSNRSLIDPFAKRRNDATTDAPGPDFAIVTCTNCTALPDPGPNGRPIPVPPPKPPIISHTTEAMLLKKVVPDYPIIAKLSGIQGEVKLHAFVSKEGTIESLTVMSSPSPILSKAALDAVQQWKYRPYYLNGQPTEIETFVIVTFKRSN